MITIIIFLYNFFSSLSLLYTTVDSLYFCITECHLSEEFLKLSLKNVTLPRDTISCYHCKITIISNMQAFQTLSYQEKVTSGHQYLEKITPSHRNQIRLYQEDRYQDITKRRSLPRHHQKKIVTKSSPKEDRYQDITKRRSLPKKIITKTPLLNLHQDIVTKKIVTKTPLPSLHRYQEKTLPKSNKRQS